MLSIHSGWDGFETHKNYESKRGARIKKMRTPFRRSTCCMATFCQKENYHGTSNQLCDLFAGFNASLA